MSTENINDAEILIRNVKQRVLAVIEDGKMSKIQLVPDGAYIIHQENAESILNHMGLKYSPVSEDKKLFSRVVQRFNKIID